jgi:hypothetical protein
LDVHGISFIEYCNSSKKTTGRNRDLKRVGSWPGIRKHQGRHVAGDLESLKAGNIKTSRDRDGRHQGGQQGNFKEMNSAGLS